MSQRTHNFVKLPAGTMIILIACVWAVRADVPPYGWLLAGSRPMNYEVGVDTSQASQGHSSAFLKSKWAITKGFGTLMQEFAARQYLGKRVRFRAMVKSQDVIGWAGLWMRVDSEKEVVAFDNMHNRSIRGTNGWQPYDVVLDVPGDAADIALGILLNGDGEVWLNGASFEVVGSDVPVTSLTVTTMPDKPVNLTFDK